MDVETVPEIYSQQRQGNIFHKAFECLQYRHLKAQKASMMHTEEKIA